MGFIINPYQYVAVAGWDFQDDFTTDTWTDYGTGFGVSSGAMQWNTATGSGSWKDLLGYAINNTAFVLRQAITIANHSSPANEQPMFMLTDTSGTIGEGVQYDFLAVQAQTIATKWKNWHGNNVILSSADPQTEFTSHTIAVGTSYLEMIRLSATALQVTFYSNSGYSSIIQRLTETISSGYTNLRYGRFHSRLGAGGVINGTADTYRLADGVTVAP